MGGEAFVHVVRQWCERHRHCPDAALLLLDWRNAFNGVDRRTFLQECLEHIPRLYAWVRWCYGQPSHLLFGSFIIASQAGAQQGDPLAGLLFALVLRVVCIRVGLLQPQEPVAAAPTAGAAVRTQQTRHDSAAGTPSTVGDDGCRSDLDATEERAVPSPDARASAADAGDDADNGDSGPPASFLVTGQAQPLAGFYYDDGALGGSSAQVLRGLQGLCLEGPRVGLHFATAAGKNVLIRPCPTSTVAVDAFPDFVTRAEAGSGLAILKAPIGDADFREAHTRKRVDSQIVPCLHEVEQLPDPHVAYRLLVTCCSSAKMAWTMRTTPLTDLPGVLTEFDTHVRSAFERIVSFSLTKEEWVVASFPTRKGGVGLRPAASNADAAYVASRRGCFDLCRRIDPHFSWEASHQSGSPLAGAIDAINTRLPPARQLLLTDTRPVKQHTLSAAMEAVHFVRHLSQSSTEARAHALATSAPHAGAWLTGVPSPSMGLWLAPDQFRIAMHLWLGVPICEGDAVCPLCTSHVPDLGLHAIKCKNGGDITFRHDQLRDIVWRLCKAAGLRPEVEKVGLLPGTLSRPADVYLPRYPGGGPAKIALDQK
eukprot:gene57790-biopygen112413